MWKRWENIFFCEIQCKQKRFTFIILSAGPCSTVTWDFSVVLKLSSTKCNLVLWWWRSTHTGIYIEYFMSKVKSLLYIQCNHKPLGSKNILILSWLPRLATLAQCIQPDRLKFPWDPSQIIVCPGTSLTLQCCLDLGTVSWGKKCNISGIVRITSRPHPNLGSL